MSGTKPRIQVELRRYAGGEDRVAVEVVDGSARASIAMPPGDARKVAEALLRGSDQIDPRGPPPDRPASEWAMARAGNIASGEGLIHLARAFDEIRAEAIDQAAALLRSNSAAGPDEILALGPEDAPLHEGEQAMPSVLRSYVFDELDRHAKAMARLVQRSIPHRMHIAYAALGSAIAFVDSFGGDAEMFLRSLRRQERRAPVLLPPKGEMS